MPTVLTITVVPSSGKQGFARDAAQSIKCFLKSAPEKGKANDELIKLLSKHLKVSQGLIMIIRGQTSRKKVVKIDVELDEAVIAERLKLPHQTVI